MQFNFVLLKINTSKTSITAGVSIGNTAVGGSGLAVNLYANIPDASSEIT